MQDTLQQYNAALAKCREVYGKKLKDYGTAWRILRPSSLTDQIFIKANRIRTLETTGLSKVGEDIEGEYIGIVNYCAMALIQLEKGAAQEPDMPESEALKAYEKELEKARDLMERKNHDYGEAWREMRVSSLTDLILMKIMRTKQIEDNQGETLISEGLDANYLDMLNYAVFALIRLGEK